MQEALGVRLGLLGIDAVDYAVFHPVGVSQDVAVVEANDVGEIADAGFVAIDRIGLDHVLHHVAEELAVEDAGDRRRPQLHRCQHDVAVEGLGDRDADHAGIVFGGMSRSAVNRFPHAHFRPEGPSAEESRQRNCGVDVEAAHDVLGLESGFVTGDALTRQRHRCT